MRDAIVAQVLQTTLNINGLIQACQAMGTENPAAKADAKNLRGLRHTITTLDEIQRRPYLTGNVLHLGYMVVCRWEDMPVVLAHTAGMPHLYHDQVQRACCAIVAGSVNQWLDACTRACSVDADRIVRYVFNRVYLDLEKHLPIEMLGRRKDNDDGTFLLEHK